MELNYHMTGVASRRMGCDLAPNPTTRAREEATRRSVVTNGSEDRGHQWTANGRERVHGGNRARQDAACAVADGASRWASGQRQARHASPPGVGHIHGLL